ncbi:MAG: autotransporter outer membrane beta-barrel domain-containing protein, partial [Sutterella sp.]
VDGSIVRSLELGDDGILTVRMEDRADLARTCGLDDVAGLGLVYAMYEQDKNLGASESVKFNNWLYTANAFNTYINADEERDVNTKLIKEIAGESAALGATTGVQTVTLDAVNMMADTAAARTSILSRKTEGARVWADMNGGSFEAKKLFGGAGYSADIWAGSIGVDYTAACGGTIGAALTIGTADTDSRNTGVRSSADSDLVGFTVYANKTFNDVLNVAADLGYLKASNDVTANGYEHSWKFAQDTDAFTFGIRGEILAKAGSANIVPHAGLRWTRISTDGFEAGYTTDVASMNVFQLPLGVTVSGEFEAAGWTIAPKVDFSVVPAFGDKDAELRLGIAGVSASEDLTVRTVDSSPVQAALGLSAEKGGWAFDLGCKLGAGSGSRMNSMFNAGVRYAF